MKKLQKFFSWAFVLASASVFVYDLVKKDDINKFDLWNLQLLEAGLLIFFFFSFSSLYVKGIKSQLVHLISLLVGFVVIVSIRYEFDSTLWIVLHSLCYTYFIVIVAIATRK